MPILKILQGKQHSYSLHGHIFCKNAAHSRILHNSSYINSSHNVTHTAPYLNKSVSAQPLSATHQLCICNVAVFKLPNYTMASQPVLYPYPYQTLRQHIYYIYIYIALHSKWWILFNNIHLPISSATNNIIKRKTLPMARDPTSPASLQTDPQHRSQNGFPNSIIIFKGKPYPWLATHPWLATNQPIPNLGVKVKMDGA